MSQTEEKIVQIIPAFPGWEAVWAEPVDADERGEPPGPEYFTVPVLCWALVECKGERRVVAMVPGIETEPRLTLADIAGTDLFIGYASPGNTIDWSERAVARRQRIEAQQALQAQEKGPQARTEDDLGH